MPIREFRCGQCGANFEKIERASQAAEQVVCPCCGSRDLEKKLSSFSTQSGGSTQDSAPMSHANACGMGNMCCMNRN